MDRKIALITGGGRGIGAAAAKLAASEGYDVCISYLGDAASAEGVVEACKGHGTRAMAVKGNVASSEDIERIFASCDSELGPVTHLVNNAGIIGKASKLVDLDRATLEEVMTVNINGVFLCSQQAVRRMSTEQGGQGGVIINLSSTAATMGSPGEYIHYAASKAAVETFTLGLSKEVGPEGIRVNTVQAGTTDTEIHQRSGNPDRPAMVARTAPLRKIATVDDMAEAIIWLMSDKAGHITGATLRVAGGI